jgi:hypothetical protein
MLTLLTLPLASIIHILFVDLSILAHD